MDAMVGEEEHHPDELNAGESPEVEADGHPLEEDDGVSKNFHELEDDPLERAQKEGGEEAEFDLSAQVEMFLAQIEEEPDNCIHHYNLAEAYEELGQHEDARAEYEMALECDKEKEYHAIIHYGLGNFFYGQLLSGIQSIVVKSSVGLHSAHKAGSNITQVYEDDYKFPIDNFEKALQYLPQLKADDDLVDYISKETPGQLANVYYKWASDLIDKSRQIEKYGDEIKDVKQALKLLKKALEIDANHAQANLSVKYAKKMLAEGWKAYDEYGFEAKHIEGEEQ